MIDSPYIRIDKSLISQSNLKKLVSKVDLTKESINHETGNKSIYGNYKNFKIAVNNKSVCVNGSLPKFVLGNNVESLSVSETSTALIELSNELSIPILKGDLTRIDIAESFPVDAKTSNYFFSLMDTPTYTSNRDIYGVRYSKNNIVLSFYDKSMDTLNSGCHSKYGLNVIRIELRIMNHIKRTLFNKSKRIVAVSMLSKTFNKKLAGLWYNHFNAILLRRVLIDHGKMKGWKDFREYLTAYSISEQKIQNIFSKIDLVAQENNWTSYTKHVVKSQVKNVYNSDLVNKPNSSADELKCKVEKSLIKDYLNFENPF